jgi:hypothetical protein
MDYPEKEEAIKEEQRFELVENGRSEKVKEGTTKFVKPKTEVHRTQYIFGLKGQKAAAERRRFDVNKIIHNHPKSILPSFDEDEDNRQYSSESRSDEETNRGLLLNRSTEERDPSSAESLYKDEYETSSSRYSQRSKSSVEETLREEGSRRRYDSDIVEEYSSAEEESSQSVKKDIVDDDERRYCCCRASSYVLVIELVRHFSVSAAHRGHRARSQQLVVCITSSPSSPLSMYYPTDHHFPSQRVTPFLDRTL